jgi:hypothetical protein
MRAAGAGSQKKFFDSWIIDNFRMRLSTSAPVQLRVAIDCANVETVAGGEELCPPPPKGENLKTWMFSNSISISLRCCLRVKF